MNRIRGLLMERGAPYHKSRPHGGRYFREPAERLEEAPAAVKDLLWMSRSMVEMFESAQPPGAGTAPSRVCRNGWNG
jgi:hypothetical protein